MELFKSRARVVYTNAVGDKVYPVVVDIKKGIKSTEEVTFVSSDINTGILSVAFVQGNEIYNVSGAEVVCSVMRPDASTLEIPCEVVSGNIVEVPLGVNGTSQDGVYSMDFKIFKGGNKVVGTPIMNYSVSLSIGNDMVVEEDDRLPILTMLMTQVGTLKEEVTSVISQANDTIELARVATNNAVDATNNANATIERVSQDVVEVIEEVEARANASITTMVNTVNEKVVEMDTAKLDMTNTVSNKVNEIETRFNTLTSSKQQSSEVIDARDGEVSLKARLDRDIEKAKQIYVDVEGSNIHTDSSSGYAKDVEIKGNTIQSVSNLADIRSVGDKVEGQELYKIDVVSCGKNLWDGAIAKGRLATSGKFSILTNSKGHCTLNPIRIYPNTSYRVTKSDWVVLYNKDLKVTRYVSAYSAFTTLVDEVYCGFYTLEDTVDLNMAQLEEGTKATPYEPYQEDKLTILSPVQLEKVGDVADRIICKDGVWGVEKLYQHNWDNISFTTPIGQFDGDDFTEKYNVFRLMKSQYSLIENGIYPFFRLDGSFAENFKPYDGECVWGDDVYLYFKILKGKTTLDEFKAGKSFDFIVLSDNPQFIPLPHDQQVKLRTFANRTNISFGCEIEGTIKAQVPKSLGATVNTHTEQINNLNKELDRVKKLEESTVSTITTESDFTTVEATSNGYFENVKLEGNTLVNKTNIFDKVNPSGSGIHRKTSNSLIVDYNKCGELDKAYSLDETEVFKSGQTYTVVIDIIQNTLNQKVEFYPMIWDFATIISGTQYVNVGEIGRKVLVLQANKNYPLKLAYASPNQATQGVTGLVEFKDIMVLDGDYTNKELPSFFEGLKSVGDDVDEVSVESVNENLFDVNAICNTTLRKDKYNWYVFSGKPNTKYTIYANTDKSNRLDFYFKVCTFDYSKTIGWMCHNTEDNARDYITFTTDGDGKVGFAYSNIGNSSVNFYNKLKAFSVYRGELVDLHINHQSDKKPLLYYNPTTETWEKPILRQWDSIEKHSDGKYYYHQRSGEVVLNGSEGWKNVTTSITDKPLYSLSLNQISNNIDSITTISDKFKSLKYADRFNIDYDDLYVNNSGVLYVCKNVETVEHFIQWLQTNNVTVVYQLAQEEVYECTNIDLITYANETNYIVNCGAIAPKSILKVHNNISNVVKILQEKVSILESNVKASQEMQDMMILESDMRILELEMALMPMNIELNIGGNPMLRSATYYNFIKRHIESETYSKEYLENVMNKYLATNRLTEAEYDELYKILYPPVYDIELPIEL